MTDDIDIREGGVVAVDTGSLRMAADRYARAAGHVRDVAEELQARARTITGLGPAAAYGGSVPATLQHAAYAAASDADDLSELARELRELADTYEIVELRARQAMTTGAGARAGTAVATWSAERAHPDAAGRADAAIGRRDIAVGLGVTSEANGGAGIAGVVGQIACPSLAGALGGAMLSLPLASQELQGLIRRLGRGSVSLGDSLSGTGTPVEVWQESEERVVAPPLDLADALRRIPDGARVRVETYTLADGEKAYAVYLAGTRDFSPHAGEDPWDLTSDARLYLGLDASAYDAVVQALDRAGVPPGARLYVFGHSQGGLIADWLAVQGGYEPRMLVTAGSPTEAEVGPETVSIQLRHTDDLVQSLAAGGSDARVGADGSLVVERTGDPAPGIRDLSFAPHHLAAYIVTARMLDAAPDPRTEKMRSVLGELQGARSGSAVEFDARRRAPRPGAGRGGT